MARVHRNHPEDLPDLDASDEPSVGGPTPVDRALLILRAAWRRKWIAALVLVAGLGATVFYFAGKRPSYEVDTKILASRQLGPSSVRGGYDELPTRSAWELVHRRENLIAIVRSAKLVQAEEGPREPRKPGLALRLGALAGREVSLGTEDPQEVLVTVLHKRLVVTVEDGTITISLIWPDPQQAYDVVQAALTNFLEARYVQEVRAAEEVISVLQVRAAALRVEYEAASDEARRRPVRRPRMATTRTRPPSEELVRLQSIAESKQRALADVEEFRRRRVADFQAQLEQARNTLSDAHPKVVGLRKDIEVASRDTPQLEALREEERAARKHYADRLAREAPGTQVTTGEIVPATDPNASERDEDPRVRQLRIESETMGVRLAAAQLELDAVRAAFKYRYNVIWPPQHPTEPVSPNPKKIFPAGVFASIVLALLIAAAPDLLRGRICEAWQVERGLGLPILGKIERK